MVHSTFAQGHVLSSRDPSSSLGVGIPKSPSFHSGLDLVASASVDSLVKIQDSTPSSFESKTPETNLNLDESCGKRSTSAVYPPSRSPYDNGSATNGSLIVFGIRKEAYSFNAHLQLCRRKSAYDAAARLNFQELGHLPHLAGDKIIAEYQLNRIILRNL